MSRFRLSPEAAQDLTEIYEYIAQDSIEAAERVQAQIHQELRSEMPGKGPGATTLPRGLSFFWLVRFYLVIYLADSNSLQIVAILHGKRNIRRILKER